MRPYKRIIAGFLAIATLSANIIAASADVSSDPGVKVGWWTAQLHNLAQRSDGLSIKEIPYGSWLCSIAASLSGKVCEFSDDHWHHADESHYIKISEGKDGTYGVRATCQYCSKEFAVGGLTADDLSSKYNDYVSNLPASGYDSAGKLLWQPKWSDIIPAYAKNFIVSCSDNNSLVTLGSDGVFSYASSDWYTASVSGPMVVASSAYMSSPWIALGSSSYFRVAAPINGFYTLSQQVVAEYTYDTGASTGSSSIGKWRAESFGSKSAGAEIMAYFSDMYGGYVKASAGRQVSVVFRTPVFEIIPASTSLVNNTYNINTRVNNFQGDYYDSVTNNYYNNTTIINETTNNYYDMTTNNYYTMSNWSYDYQSRTYFVTLEDGTTITVQFGDDCLTITNNNVENSYQYVIKNSGSSDPDTPTTCKHNWTETIDVEPTCLEGGHANYTCSLCGETYEQILSAKGHNWTVKEHVNTVYGENGEIVTQGHTLYECSTCGEQWYTETAAPPPDVSGGGTIISWLTNFQTWLGDTLSVGLTVNLGSIVDKLQVLIDNSTSTVENVTNVDIDETNTAFNVFYVTGEDGEKKPIGEVSGDALSASGKLLNFLYKLVFENALSKVDDSITSMSDFYFDDGAGTEGSIWD